MLSHRVGLTHNTYDRDLEANADYRALVQKLAYAPMTCQPGDCYAYQNIAFSLIGDVVFAATGSFYSQAVERRIFKPLGMNDASLGLEGIEGQSALGASRTCAARGGWVSLMPKPTYYRVAARRRRQRQHQRHGAMADRADRAPSRRAAGAAAGHAACAGDRHAGRMRGSSWRRERLNRRRLCAGLARVRLRRPPGGIPWRRRAGLSRRGGDGARNATSASRSCGTATARCRRGLLPTILDRAIGLPPRRWLDDEIESQTLYANRPQPHAGVDASTAEAMPEYGRELRSPASWSQPGSRHDVSNDRCSKRGAEGADLLAGATTIQQPAAVVSQRAAARRTASYAELIAAPQ